MNSLFLTLLTLNFTLVAHPALAGAEKCQNLFSSTARFAKMSSQTTSKNFTVGYGVNEFTETSAARIYVELATKNMLLSQSAQSLDSKGLLIPNGGLCVSACLTNLLGAMTAHYDNFLGFPRNAPEVLELLVHSHNQQFSFDARLGTYVHKLSDVMSSFFPQILQGFQFDSQFENINITRSQLELKNPVFEISRALRDDAIAILTTEATDPMLKDIPPHAVVLLKIDSRNQKVYISDPNRPNLITVTPYVYASKSEINFRLPYTFQEFSVRITDVDVFTRTIHRVK